MSRTIQKIDIESAWVLQCVVMYCSVLQCLAVSCSVLQCVAVTNDQNEVHRASVQGAHAIVGGNAGAYYV